MILRTFISLHLIVCFLFIYPTQTFAAEVLQVRSSSLLQIGDRNRTYTVKLACLDVDPLNEKSVMRLLKAQLRRKTRVNLRPEGINNGVLLARVSLLENKIDIGQSIIDNDLGRNSC